MVKKLSAELTKQLDTFNKDVGEQAEVIIFDVFPQKIIELQKLITEASSPSSIYHLSHSNSFTDVTIYPAPASSTDSEVPASKKRKIKGEESTNGAVASDAQHARYPNVFHANKHLLQVHAEVKKQCEELAMNCDKVKLWINLSMPRIEDGDNFGVQVQEECLNELHRSQESSMNLRDNARAHLLTRAKIASKLIKYPHIEDYALGLKEHDEKQLYMARQHLYDLRNIYAVLTDILHKNIVKLRVPKGNNSAGLY